MDNLPIITGQTGLVLTCAILTCGFALFFFSIWLYVACLVDAFRKSEVEFPDRTIWITILIGSNFVGASPLATIIYYILFRPKLRFWRTNNT